MKAIWHLMCKSTVTYPMSVAVAGPNSNCEITITLTENNTGLLSHPIYSNLFDCVGVLVINATR